MVVAWLIATIFFVIAYISPCRSLPSEKALGYYEAESELDDFYAGGALVDRRGLKHFPRLWCGEGQYSSYGQLFFMPIIQQVMHLRLPRANRLVMKVNRHAKYATDCDAIKQYS